jgi:predicted DNA-binding transcriptional regulator AlpA
MTASATKDRGRERLARVGVAPRGLDRLEAAAYVGVSPGVFDRMVADRRMPSAREIDARHVWDRLELDRAFDALPHVAGRAATEPDDVWSQTRV